MEAHGGDIGVYSDGQAGSTFFVDIPIVEGRTSLPTISSQPEDGGMTERSETAGVSGKGLNTKGLMNKGDYEEEGYGNIFDIEKTPSVFQTPNASSKAGPPLPEEMSYSMKSRRHSSVSFSNKHGGMYSNTEAVKALTSTQQQPSHIDSNKTQKDSHLNIETAPSQTSATEQTHQTTTSKLPAINAYPSPSPRARSQSMYSMTSPRNDTDPIVFVNNDDMPPMRSKSQPKEAPVHHAYSFNDVKALSQTRQASHSALPKPHWSSVLLVDDCVGIRKITTRSLASSVQIDDFEEVRII